MEFWYIQETHAPKCTRIFQKPRETYKILVHVRASCSKVYQTFLKIQRNP